MKYLDLTLSTPTENMALDEALLVECDEGRGGEVLRFWESEVPFVVVGYSNHVMREVNVSACEAAGVPVLRRCSGGGTVLQGPGCLNFSLVLRRDNLAAFDSVDHVHQHILGRHRQALAPLVHAPIEIAGQSDLALGGLKFSGNAQRRLKHSLLYHGAFLLSLDLANMAVFLAHPSMEPSYRAGRAHDAFVTNLAVAPSLVKDALRAVWNAQEPVEQAPMGRVEAICRSRYNLREWNFWR